MTAQIISGVVIAVVVAVAGAFAGHLLTRSRERERWDREDRRQRDIRKHEWQLQHRSDRIEVYRRFLADLREIEPRAGEADFETWDEVEFATREAAFLGSKPLREAAHNLFAAHINRADFRGRIMSGELQEDDPKERAEIERRDHILAEESKRFISAAHKDLGLDFDSPDAKG